MCKNSYIQLFSVELLFFSEDLWVIMVAGCPGSLEEPLAEALEFTQVTQETSRMASALSSVCSEPCIQAHSKQANV